MRKRSRFWAVALVVAAAEARSATPEDKAAWAAGIDYSATEDPGRELTSAEERAFFRRLMLENLEAWSPGAAPFDIAVPAPFYRRDGRLIAFDVFPLATGKPNAAVVGWEAYATELSAIVGNTSALTVAPDAESFAYGRNGDVAWMSMEMTVSPTLKAGGTVHLPVRTSLVVERTVGRWLIVQEHVSTPFLPARSVGP